MCERETDGDVDVNVHLGIIYRWISFVAVVSLHGRFLAMQKSKAACHPTLALFFPVRE